jgi:hypothetical protein
MRLVIRLHFLLDLLPRERGQVHMLAEGIQFRHEHGQHHPNLCDHGRGGDTAVIDPGHA